jgi:hypothetical protein
LYLYLEVAPYVGRTHDILYVILCDKVRYDIKCVYAAGGGWMRPPPTHDILYVVLCHKVKGKGQRAKGNTYGSGIKHVGT